MSTQESPPHRRIASLRQRMTPAAWFFAQIGFGAVVLVGAGWLFGEIAEDVVEDASVVLLDMAIAGWFHTHAYHPLTQLMLGISLANGSVGLSVLALLLAGYFVWKHEWYWLLGLAFAVPGGMLLNVLTKLAFHRARPHFADPLVDLATYSFPSGHTLGATVFYGTLAAYLVMRVSSLRLRLLVVAAALAMIANVGLSRVYLGAHFLTDVLAAFAEGCAWLGLSLIAVATLQRRLGLRPLEPKAAAHRARV